MTRVEPDPGAGELDSLCQYLDAQRATLVRLCEGLTKDQLAVTVGASQLTLAGLLKHLALVEDWWFQVDMMGRSLPEEFAGVDWDEDPDWEFTAALRDEPADLMAAYGAACDRSRAVVAELGDLDARSVSTGRRDPYRGEHYSLRWVMLHMIEETARHLGHADLIRQQVDGATDL